MLRKGPHIIAFAAAFVYHVLFKMQIKRPDDALALIIWAPTANALWALIAGQSDCAWCVLLQCNAIFIFTALILQIAYNVYGRHRRVPGSFWYTATDLTYGWGLKYTDSRFRTDTLRGLQRMHSKMGDVIRIQPNHLSFSSVEAIEDIHGAKSKLSKLEPYVSQFTSESGPNVFNTIDKSKHAALRRTMKPVSNMSTLDEISPTIEVFLQRLITGIEKEAKEREGLVDMKNWLYNFTFATIGYLSFGYEFNGVKTKEPHEFVMQTVKFFKGADKYMFLSWTHKLDKLINNVIPGFLGYKKHEGEMEKMARESIEQMLKHGDEEGRRTILTALEASKDPLTEEKLGMNELISNTTLLLYCVFIVRADGRSAGSQTTGNTIAYAFVYLLNHRRCLNQLTAEIRRHFRTVADITTKSVRELPYLDAVVREGLRFSAIPFGPTRLTPPEGAVINGVWVEGNTYVSIANFALHRDPRYFSDPESFIPERWLENNNSEETCCRKAFLGFGYGPRECLGKHLAVLEMKMVFAGILLKYDLDFADGPMDPMDDLWAQVTPLKLRITNITTTTTTTTTAH